VPSAVDAFDRVDALIQVGLRLARSAPSGKVLLARIAGAIDPVWIPRPWGAGIVAELEAARVDACQPVEFPRIERTLRDAWGAQPTDELDELSPEPVAVTPSAQVHRGLLDGAPVAVKVLRPGLASAVRQDLSLLEGLLAPMGAAFPALDPTAIVREFRERVLDELDLEHEASVQRAFHRALRHHPVFEVPAPITRLAHENVLVSEWIEGIALWDAPDPDQAAAQLVLFILGAGRWGTVHADPDPDDVRVLPDGRLAVLDFGATRAVNPERVRTAGDALEAFVAGDVEAFGEALERLGALPARAAAMAIDLLRHALGELAGAEPTRLDSDAVLAARDRLFDRPQQLTELIAAGALPPEDLWPARAATQLFAAIARVGATGSWRELCRMAARDGWEAAISLSQARAAPRAQPESAAPPA
jgi:predicted unusual protein kinase regulating ubiquinone biosynthesis (AarF/ABC1/UbiB family)